MSLSFCIKDVLYIYNFRKNFERFINPAVVGKIFGVIIGEDNRACPAYVQIDRLSYLSGNGDLKYKLIVDHVGKGEMRVELVPSGNMVADVMTRHVSVRKFQPSCY